MQGKSLGGEGNVSGRAFCGAFAKVAKLPKAFPLELCTVLIALYYWEDKYE